MNVNRREFVSGAMALSLVGWRRIAAAAGYPDYYAAQFAAVSSRVGKLAKTCPFGFWFLTDLHMPLNQLHSGDLLAAFVKATPLGDVICGGDLPEAFRGKFPSLRAAIDFATDLYRERWVKPIRAAGGKVYTARGNHDFTVSSGPGGERLTFGRAETHQLLIGDFTEPGIVTNPVEPEGFYYYFDNPAARVRVVVLDTTGDYQPKGDAVCSAPSGIHMRQFKWLAREALGGTPKGWCVVVVHHIPIAGFVGDDDDEKTHAHVRQLLEAYQNRRVFENAAGRFDFCKAGGRILIDITGHHHAERQTFQDGILHVTEPCDVAYPDYLTGSQPRKWDLPRKVAGTVAEQTFDAVQFDIDGGLVHFTRVGGGGNRTMHLRPLTVRAGEKLRLPSSCLGGRVGWLCYDGDRHVAKPNPKSKYVKLVEWHENFATVTPDGELSAKAPGPVMAVAYTPSGDQEIFPVTVR